MAFKDKITIYNFEKFIWPFTLISFLHFSYGWFQEWDFYDPVNPRFATKILGSPNLTGFLLLINLIFSIYLFANEKFRARIFLSILILFFSTTLIFTQSDGAIVTAISVFLILVISSLNNKLKILSLQATIFLLLTSVIFLFLTPTSSIKINGNDLSLLSSGRIDIWKNILQYDGLSNLFFGHGPGSIKIDNLYSYDKTVNSSHNFYLYIYYSYGIAGVILMLTLILETIKIINKNKSKYMLFLKTALASSVFIVSFFDNHILAGQALWLFSFLFAFLTFGKPHSRNTVK